MTKALWLLMLAPAALQAQMELTLINGTQQTPLTTGNSYSLGQVLPVAPFQFTVQARNTGSAAAPCNPAASGAGFTISSPCGSSQSNVAPGAVLNVTFTFAGSLPGSYSTSFQFGTAGPVYFVITVVPLGLTTATPCTGPGQALTIDFGSIPAGQTEQCAITLTNNGSQSLTVTLSVAGTSLVPSLASGSQVTIAAAASTSFRITFQPASAAVFPGTLTVDSEIFTLTGTAFNAVLPAPSLQLDTNTPQSGQQITLSLTLPSPAPATVNGSVTLGFQPDSSVASIVADDPNINFVLTSARSAPFSIPQGSTTALFNGQPGVIFATGSTAGKITLTGTLVSGAQWSANPELTVAIAPAAVYIEQAAATAIAGALNVQVWGLDNTYSAGKMVFTFLDNLGNTIGTGPIPADFTKNFQGYFSQFDSMYGSMFTMLVSFPITGNAAEVGSVNVQMSNAAGTTTQNLVFLNDTGTCVLIGNLLSCPAAPTQ